MNHYFIGAIACGVLTAVTIIIPQIEAKKMSKVIVTTPIISTEEELRSALEGEPQGYLVENALLTGETVTDPYYFFEPDSMLYIRAEKESYQLLHPEDKNSTRDWVTVKNPTETVSSPKFFLYGDIPFPIEQFGITQCRNLSKVCKESTKGIIENDWYYYPEGNQWEVNNIRYSFYCLKNNEPITFAAKIGNNQFIAEPVNSIDASISQFTSADQRIESVVNSAKFSGLLFSAVFIMGGIVFLVYGIKEEI